MKQLLILTALLLLTVGTVKSQQRPPATLGLYASFGLREVKTPKPLVHASKNPSSATTIGAGYSWRKNQFLVGTEFYFANKHQETSSTITHYTGFSSAFLAGYQILRLKEWCFYPVIGAGITQNKLMFFAKSQEVAPPGQSCIYTQNAMLLQPAISIEKINAQGMLMGISLGYSASIQGKKA